MVSVPFQGRPFNITGIQVFTDHWCCRSWNWPILWRPARFSRTNTKKRCPLIIADWNAKVWSQDTWNNRQVWPWSMKWSRAKATEFCQENTLVIASNKPRDDYTGGHLQMTDIEMRLIMLFAAKLKKLYSVCKNKTWSWLWLSSWAAYCKIQAEIEESRETTRL